MRALRRTVALAGATALVALVASASPATAATNDTLRSKQWGLTQVRAEQAWSTSRGAGAVIAVVDTGVDLTHPDLAAKLVPGGTFVGCSGSASCGDGNWKGVDGVGQDVDAHGTHVAGIAAAITNNETGVAGVAPDARIMPVKVLEDGSGNTADIANGIRWSADHGADVINLSLGSLPGTQVLSIAGLDTEIEQAIDYARTKGALSVIAAGNTSTIACTSPGFSSTGLCVGSTDKNELHSAFSELPIKPDLKVVSAPGGFGFGGCDDDVWSTVPTGAASGCGVGGYDAFAGTSMATPHVAGVAALLLAQGRTVAQAEKALTTTARTPVLGMRGTFTPLYGYGVVDAQAAVASAR
ncbi:peptidase S8 [Knoellia sinensis KCTC 19936]|uniref:Peptidase S8 n=1 Tax=Knoellia sinensis KCTC 19936 TaxID=1385520 RepID=A0A0A0J2Q6_9MICO|nr:S8 family serine peptidase [Knoellia sinensis]KGN30422.1 peptidase S8 [Knoellia sinensis KCTC 19936]